MEICIINAAYLSQASMAMKETRHCWRGTLVRRVLRVLQPTCQGYSWTSVSTPPTMRVLLLATPQLQLLGPGAGEEVVVSVTPSVVLVATGAGVVGVWAKTKQRNQYILNQSWIFLPLISSHLARKPVPATRGSEWNLTFIDEPQLVIGPGREVPQYFQVTPYDS